MPTIYLQTPNLRLVHWLAVLFIFSAVTVKGQQYSKNIGGTSSAFGFGSAAALKTQLIYTNTDLGSPITGVINRVYFKNTVAGASTTLSNFVIKLGATSSANSFPGSGTTFFTGLVTVLSQTSYTINGGSAGAWFSIPVSPKLMLVTGQNLIVEISFTSSSNVNFATTTSLGTSAPANQKLYAATTTATTGSVSTNWQDFGIDFGSVFTAPANDVCGAANPLVLNTSCSTTEFVTVGSTQSLAAVSCEGGTSSAAKDVWFSFTANAFNDSIFVGGLGGFDPVVQLFSGSCAALTSLACSDDPINNVTEVIAPGNLIAGNTYLLRVYGWSGIDGTFLICAKSNVVAAPVNDACGSATVLLPTPSCTAISGTNLGATQTVAPIVCEGATSSVANDVWYRFTANTANDSVIVTPASTMDPVVQLYSGSCGALTTLTCSDDPAASDAVEKVATGTLIPGATYFVRVYGFGPNTGLFTICAKTTVAAPVNNLCSAATGLSSSTSCNPTSGTNVGATQSLAPITCNTFTSSSALDVWYTFVANGAGDSVIVAPNGGFDPILEVFSGTCSAITSIGCSDNVSDATEKVSTGTLIPGNTYYIRVYGWAGSEGTFSICVKRVQTTTVANDNCSGATVLTVGTTCNMVNGTTANATPSAQAACTGTPDDDVWYQFPVTVSGNYVFKMLCLPGFDGAMQIYTGSCSALTQRACIDRAIAGSQEDTLLALTAGSTIYVRIYHADPGSGTSSFGFCAFRAAAPANDNCSGALNVTVGASGVCNPILTSSYVATQSQAPITCNGFTSSVANDIWARVVPTSTTLKFFVDNVGASDPVVEAFSGTCASLVSIACADDSASGAGETINLTGLTVGVAVYFRIYNWGGNAPFADFQVCAQQGGCVSTAGTAVVTPANVVSNGSVLANLTGFSGTVNWQYSSNGSTWTALGSTLVPDTFYVRASVKDTFYLRAQVTTGTCLPAFSAVGSFVVECGTPMNNLSSKLTGNYISNLSFAGINNSSTFDPFGGGYQNFRNVSGTACKGRSYAFSLTPSTTSNFHKAVWIDFNNDGDFADPGENVLAPFLSSGLFTANLAIPANAVTGAVRMRVYLFNAGTSTPSTDPCFAGPYDSGEIEEYVLNISPAPSIANAGTNFSSCSPTASLNATVPTSGTGSWSVISGGATLVSNTAANTDVTNLSLGANIFQWTVTTACTTSTATVTVTYTGPTTVANAGSDQNICADNATLSGNNPGASTGVWTLFSGSGVISSPNAFNSNVSGLGVGLNQFIWTITTAGCTPSKDTVRILRSQSPTVANAGADQNICGTSAQLSGNVITVGTGTWSLVSGSGTIQTPNSNNTVVIGLSSGSNVFRWTSTNGTCTASQDEVSIVVTPAILANAGQDQSICADQATLGGNSAGTGTGIWTVLSGSGTVTNPNQANSSVTGLAIGTNRFVWSITTGNCPVTKDTVSVTRAGQTVANAGTDQSVCGGQATLAANTPGSGSGVWTVVSGSGQFAGATDPNTIVTNLGTGQNSFRWTVTNAPCSPAQDDVTITNLGNATIADAGQDQTLCSTNATLSGNVAVFGVGQWSLISGAGTVTSPSAANSPVTGLGVGLNVFRWTISNGNCPNTVDDVILSRTASPSVSNAGPDQNICTNSTTLAANTATVGSGVWSLISGAGQIQDAFNPTTSVTGLGTGNNVFRWTITNAPCTPSSDEVTVATTLNSVTAFAGQDQVVCNTTVQLSANGAGNGTGTWTLVSGSGTFSNPNAPNSSVDNLGAGENVFAWTIVTGTCPPSIDQVSVTRTNQTALAIAGTDQNLCTSTTTLAGNNPQTGIGTWTLVSGTGNITDPSNPASTVSGLGNGANVFRWTINNFPCPPSFDEVTISTTLSAITANAGTDQTICGTVSQLIGNSPGGGTGVWTLVSGSGNITNPNASQTSVTGIGAGTNVFQWTITTGTCAPSTDQISIAAVTNPVAANAGTDQSICGTAATLSANNPGQNTGTWSLVSGSGTVANPNSASSSVVGLGSGANVFRWTITNPPCSPTFDEVTINATPGNVTAQAGADRTICGTSVFMNATAPVAGFGAWSLVSGTGIIAQPGNPVSEVTGLGEGTNVFAWTVINGTCTASDLVAVTRDMNTLDLGPDTLACMGSSYTIQAGAGFQSYVWFDQTNGPSLIVGSSGEYWVQVTSLANCTYRDTVKVTFVTCTETKPILAHLPEFNLFPNPNQGDFSVNIRHLDQPGTIRVYNIQGVLVWTGRAEATESLVTLPIRLDRPVAGLYLVELETRHGRMQHKMVLR